MTKLQSSIQYINRHRIDWTKETPSSLSYKLKIDLSTISRTIEKCYGISFEKLRYNANMRKVKRLGMTIPAKDVCKILGISKDYCYRLRRELGFVYPHGGDRRLKNL